MRHIDFFNGLFMPPPILSKVKIDTSLFMHINGDAYLTGSVGLEGQPFQRTIAYFQEYVNSLDASLVSEAVRVLQRTSQSLLDYEKQIDRFEQNMLHPQLPDEIKQLEERTLPLRHQLNQLVVLSRKDPLSEAQIIEKEALEATLKELNDSIEQKNQTLQAENENAQRALFDFSRTIHQAIQALTPDEYVLVPGGWRLSHGGHALIYQFKKMRSGDLYFSIINSGDGLKYHPKKSTPEHTLYNPALIHQIPQARIADPFLTHIIKNLLSLQIPALRPANKRDEITSEMFYKEELLALHYVDAQLVFDKHDVPLWLYTTGQLSGSCAQRSLHQMLKQCFDTKERYQQFMYGYKRYALNDYINTLKSDDKFNDVALQEQIKHAIQHLLRILALPSMQHEQEQEFPILTAYLAELTATQTLSPPQAPPACSDTPSIYHTITIPALPSFQPEDHTRIYVSTEITRPMMIRGGKDLLTDLDGLLEKCGQLNGHALFEQLEYTFVHLPLPEDRLNEPLLPFYAQSLESQEALLSFYDKLNQLQTLYFKCCDDLDLKDKVLPRMLIAKQCLVSVVGHVNNHFRLVPQSERYFHDYAFMMLIQWLQTPDAAYLATNLPHLDARAEHIRRLHKHIKEAYVFRMEARFDYYSALLNQFPELKKALSQRYNPPAENSNLNKEDADDLRRLHQLIQSEDYTALYYLSEQFKALEHEEQFKPLILLFQIQFSMERVYAEFCTKLNPLYKRYENRYDNTKKIDYGIKISLNGYSSLCCSSVYITQYTSLATNPRLRASKYYISTSAAYYALGYDSQEAQKRSSHETQIRPACIAYQDKSEDHHFDNDDRAKVLKRPIQRTDLEARELFHLRRVTKLQLQLTLDYFSRNLEKISRHNIQVYLEANLLQPGVLRDCLANDRLTHDFFTIFDAFIAKGMVFYERKGQFTEESIFFVRLAYLINQYAVRTNPTQFTDRWCAFYATINRFIVINRDKTVLNHLHCYRFLSAVCGLDLALGDQTTLAEAYYSLVQIQQQADWKKPLDRDAKFQVAHAKHEWIRCLQEHRQWITPTMIQPVLQDIGIQWDESRHRLTASYPAFNVYADETLLYVVHLEQGRLYRDSMASCPVPDWIHRSFPALNIDEHWSCFGSANNQLFLIGKGELTFRFFKGGPLFSLQKAHQVAGQTKWYTWCPLTASSRTRLLDSPSLPEVVNDCSMMPWACEDDIHFTDEQQQKILYRAQPVEHAGAPGWTITAAADGAYLCTQASSALTQRLSTFEAEKFMLVFEQNGQYRVDLPRYGMQWFLNADNTLIWRWNERDYRLIEPNKPLGEGVAQLMVTDGEQTLIVLPIQQFMKTNERSQSSVYYRLQHDTDGTLIPKSHWQYSDSEQYVTLQMEHGKPVAKTPAQALYLTYVYLASYQPDAALNMLDVCDHRLGGLRGTEEELRFIYWIMTALPQKGDWITSPAYIACKLKTLALYTDFARQGKPIKFSLPTFSRHTTNFFLACEMIKTIETFYYKKNDRYSTQQNTNPLMQALENLFDSMQKFSSDQLVSYGLNDNEILSLCNFYHKSVNKALGPTGYAWMNAHMMLLHREAAQLQAKAHRGVSTVFDERRLERIEALHNEGADVYQVTTNYTSVSCHNRVSSSANTGGDQFRIMKTGQIVSADDWFKNYQSTVASQELAMSLLAPVMAGDTLKVYLRDYLSIATNENHPHYPRLQSFCRAALMTQKVEKNEYSDYPSLFHLFCRILHCVCYNHDYDKRTEWNSYSDVVRSVASLYSPQIVRQELTDTHTPMLTSDTLWEQLPAVSSDQPVILNHSAHRPFNHWFSPELSVILASWQKFENAFYAPKSSDTDAFTPSFAINAAEEACGHAKYVAMLALKRVAQQLLQHQSSLNTLLNQQLAIAETAQKRLLEDGLSLAQRGPEDKARKLQWDIEVAAGKRRLPDAVLLLDLYMHAEQQRYAEATGLSDADIQQLHFLMTQHVAQMLQHQQLHRTQHALTDLRRATTTVAQEQACFQVAKLLFADNHVDVKSDSVLAIFQYHFNILLYPQQVAMIQQFTTVSTDGKFNNVVEAALMGEGKSTTILPLTLKLKATGKNLMVVEVPHALLKTNYPDLKAISVKLQQEAYLFEFSRDNHYSSQELDDLLAHLTRIKLNKGYVVTSGDAIQSLELKYIELLRGEAPSDRIEGMERLVALFKNDADIIIDEVHHALRIDHQLNYTIAESHPIARSILLNTLELYQFFEKVPLDAARFHLPKTLTLNDILKHNQYFNDASQFVMACAELTKQLVSHKDSPLQRAIPLLRTSQPDRDLLFAWLQNQGTQIPEFILNLPQALKDTLGLYKKQICRLLPHTLRRNQGEHYGPSKLTTLDETIRVIAIPYAGNDKASENSRFFDVEETIDLTIQSLLITGMTPGLLRLFFEDWQIQAKRECRDQALDNIDDTPTARSFKLLTEGLHLSFSELDLKDEAQLARLNAHLRYCEPIMHVVLSKYVLPCIQEDGCILHSNAYNHVDAGATVQGMTATPWNHSIYHQSLVFDEQRVKGTDGYILHGIAAKQPHIRGIEFDNPTDFVAALLEHYLADEKVRAIIDVGAMFKGVNNLLVAKAIAHYIKAHPEQFAQPEPVQYILFFNQNSKNGTDELVAISVDSPEKAPKLIGSSRLEVINSHLGCGPAARFSYYPQPQTIGADIRQCEEAKSIVTVERDTFLESFLQGSMRMRALLSGNQRMDIIVPSCFQNLSFKDLVSMLYRNQENQLKPDNFYAAPLKMSNEIRADFLGRILAAHGYGALEQKQQLLQAGDPYFVETYTTADAFSQHGALCQQEETDAILDDYQENLLQDWLQRLDDRSLSDTEQQDKHEKMQAIATRALERCHSTQLSRQKMMSRSVQVEVHQKVELHMNLEMHVQTESHNREHKVEAYVKWCDGRRVDVDNPRLQLMTLSRLCQLTDASAPQFSDAILVSTNFYKNYIGQQRLIGWYLKPVHTLLFMHFPRGLACVLLSQEETNELFDVIANTPDAWMSTTQYTVLAGTPPTDFKTNLRYQTTIEQVRYFNGELKLSCNDVANSHWLGENAKEKLSFFEKHLYPYRETLPAHLTELNTVFSVNKAVYAFITEAPEFDSRQTDWNRQFPDCDEADIPGYIALAEAVHEIKNRWVNADFRGYCDKQKSFLQERFPRIPLLALGHLEQCLEKLCSLIIARDKTVYTFITAIPLCDRRHTDWKKEFPSCDDSDILGYAALADMIFELKSRWSSARRFTNDWDIVIEERRSRLSPQALRSAHLCSSKLFVLKTTIECQIEHYSHARLSASSADHEHRIERPQMFLNNFPEIIAQPTDNDYQLILAVIRLMPDVLSKHVTILRALSTISCITTQEFQTLQDNHHDQAIVTGLLKYQSTRAEMTVDLFNQLIAQHPESIPWNCLIAMDVFYEKANTQTQILALQQISAEQVDDFIRKTRNIEILTWIAEHPNSNLVIFREVARHPKADMSIIQTCYRRMLQPLTQTIDHSRIGDTDRACDTYLQNLKTRLLQTQSLSEAQALYTEVEQVLAIQRSPQVLAIRSTIRAFKDPEQTHWYTVHRAFKAREIEAAMQRVPLPYRGNLLANEEGPDATIINHAKANVRLALAEHRHFGKRGADYVMRQGMIFPEKAAHSYQSFFTQFSLDAPEFEPEGCCAWLAQSYFQYLTALMTGVIAVCALLSTMVVTAVTIPILIGVASLLTSAACLYMAYQADKHEIIEEQLGAPAFV